MIRSFFINPVPELDKNNSFTSKVKELLISFLIFFFFASIFNIFTKFLDYLIYQETHFSFIETIQQQQKIGFKKISFFFILFLGPFMEELIFRLPLRISKLNISVSLSFLAIYFIGDKIVDINIYSINTWIKLIPIGFVFFLIYFFSFYQKLKEMFTKYYAIYFYALSVAFGLIHSLNFYKIIPINLIVFFPFFMITLILLGVFLNYIRIRLGFIWGVFAHSFFNFLILLFTVK